MAPVLIRTWRSGASRAASILLTAAAILAVAGTVWMLGGSPRPTVAATPSEATILAGAPATLDPAAAGDAGSAAVIAQVFESLTAFDTDLNIRPALAASWEVLDGGRRIVFHLRRGLTFSDGSPLTALDVVRSWMRLIDPAAPSPLASLMADVEGAEAYLLGESTDPDSVGLRAHGTELEVRLEGGAADFVAVAASPSFAVVPPGIDENGKLLEASGFVGSGGYVLAAETGTEITLKANKRYWAGSPAITTIHLVTDIGGRSPVEAFADGELDYAPISSVDASWIAFDQKLGPQLRSVPSLSVTYYGFDTSRPPFSDVRVRRAFALAVDWQRIVELAAPDGAFPATSMVPPGIPGRSERDLAPHQDIPGARQALADAGFPGGSGFPNVTLVTGGDGYEAAVVAQLRETLGIDVRIEQMDFNDYFTKLALDPPAFWSLTWIADYPGPNDFLGLLLRSSALSNYGRWVSPEFDEAIVKAGAADTPGEARTAFERAEEVVGRDAPVIPLSYGTGWALARNGLLGAGQNGLGMLRMAGLAWRTP